MNPFAFIVGCPRSGTTLLGRMVDAHPDIAVIHEGRFVADWFERRRGLTPEGIVKPELVDELLAYRPFRGVRVDRAELERLASEPISYAKFVSAIFDLHGKAVGKRLVGDKTPHYVRSLDTLNELWPQARFVHLIRDGRDVYLSARSWGKVADRGGSVARFSSWDDDPVSTGALWWEWQVRLGREAGERLGRELYHEVRYESLVADPAEVCRGVCSFLGIPYDDRMLHFHEGRTVEDPALDAKKSWQPITPGLRNWRTEMTEEEVGRFEAASGNLLDELGYPRSGTRRNAVAVEAASRARQSFTRDIEKRRRRRLPARWQA
jgi:sulfotransferase family protein